MGNKSLLILLVLFLTGCKCQQPVTQSVEYRDSIRTEYIQKTIFVPETIYYELPQQKTEIIKMLSKDSTSFLENDYATSEARVDNGMLFHNLQLKNKAIPIKIQKQIEYRDSIVYKDKQKTSQQTVEVNRLSNFQKFQIAGFWFFIVSIIIYILYRVKTK